MVRLGEDGEWTSVRRGVTGNVSRRAGAGGESTLGRLQSDGHVQDGREDGERKEEDEPRALSEQFAIAMAGVDEEGNERGRNAGTGGQKTSQICVVRRDRGAPPNPTEGPVRLRQTR